MSDRSPVIACALPYMLGLRIEGLGFMGLGFVGVGFSTEVEEQKYEKHMPA